MLSSLKKSKMPSTWSPERLNFAVIRIAEAIGTSECAGLLVEAKSHQRWYSLRRYDDALTSTIPPTIEREVQVSAGFKGSWEPSLLLPKLAHLVKNSWGISLKKFSGHGVSRYDTESRLPLHQDTQHDDGRLVTFVLYLSIAEAGGEIQFPTVDLTVATHPGDILIFPSNLPHMVAPISRGDRWVMVWFGE